MFLFRTLIPTTRFYEQVDRIEMFFFGIINWYLDNTISVPTEFGMLDLHK